MKKNEQELFWSNQFGSKYILRNTEKKLNLNNYFFFKKILKKIKFNSLLEFGSNIGSNITVLKKINKKINKIAAIEINKKAALILKEKHKDVIVFNSSISKFKPNDQFDLVLCKGILIHINPNQIKYIYDKIYRSCKKYILIAEYYNPEPIKIIYKGYSNKLFKRDFAGEMLKKYKKLNLINYGFVYHKDKHPQDDITWFLLEKN